MTKQERVTRLVEAVDFMRACCENGGNHEHAFNLHFDSETVESATLHIERINENIMRELESRMP